VHMVHSGPLSRPLDGPWSVNQVRAIVRALLRFSLSLSLI